MAKAALEAYTHIRDNDIKKIERKSSDFDLVTNLDIEVEDIIRERLKRFKKNIIGEEGVYEKDKDSFIIDPIDGTLNFINGNPLWGINIAYMENYEIVKGLIFLPILNEFYFAVKGKGVYLNGERILKDKMEGERPIIVNLFNSKLVNERVEIRNLGASSVELSWLVNKRYRGVITGRAKIWDVAPALLFCSELDIGVYQSNMVSDRYVFGDINDYRYLRDTFKDSLNKISRPSIVDKGSI
jgi:myo-inositol-1(or 4)-monophosphatase